MGLTLGPVAETLALIGTLAAGLAVLGILFWQRAKERRDEALYPFASRSWRAVALGGRELRCRYVPAAYHKGREVRPPALELSAPCPSSGCFYLSAEEPKDRWLLRLGLTREARCEVPELDASFFMACPAPFAVAALLQDPRAQAALRGLMAEGVRELDHDGETLVARLIPFRRDVRTASLPEAERSAPPLGALAAVVPGHFQAEDAASSRSFSRVRGRLVRSQLPVLLIVASVFGLVAAMVAADLYPPLEPSDLGRLIAAAAAAGLGGTYLLARRLGLRYCLPAKPLLLWAFSAGALLGVSAFTGVLLYNAVRDAGPAAARKAVVVRKDYRTHKRSRSYYVWVRSWKDAGKTYKLRVREDLYHRTGTEGGARLAVATRPGALGIEWVARVWLPAEDREAVRAYLRQIIANCESGWTVEARFDPEASTLGPEDRAFAAGLMEVARLYGAHRQARARRMMGEPADLPADLDGLERRLRALEPGRAGKARDLVAEALREHRAFYESGRPFDSLHAPPPELVRASLKLREAYAELVGLYPGESPGNQRAFHARLFCMDFL